MWGGGGRGRYGICSTDSLLFTVTTKAIYILRLISLSHKICTLMMRSHLYLTLRTHHHKILLARHCVDNTKSLGFRPGLVIVLCSWSRHSPITVSLSTQEYKWVPVNCQGAWWNAGGSLVMDKHPIQGAGVVIHLVTSGTRDLLGLGSYLAWVQTYQLAQYFLLNK